MHAQRFTRGTQRASHSVLSAAAVAVFSLVIGVSFVVASTGCTKSDETSEDNATGDSKEEAPAPKAATPVEKDRTPTPPAEKTAAEEPAVPAVKNELDPPKKPAANAPQEDKSTQAAGSKPDDSKTAIARPPVGKMTKIKPPGSPPIKPGALRFGVKCSKDGKCAKGLECVTFYGIAGSRGPKFQTCEKRCGKGKAVCPTGTQCVTIADGPGQVCR